MTQMMLKMTKKTRINLRFDFKASYPSKKSTNFSGRLSAWITLSAYFSKGWISTTV